MGAGPERDEGEVRGEDGGDGGEVRGRGEGVEGEGGEAEGAAAGEGQGVAAAEGGDRAAGEAVRQLQGEPEQVRAEGDYGRKLNLEKMRSQSTMKAAQELKGEYERKYCVLMEQIIKSNKRAKTSTSLACYV